MTVLSPCETCGWKFPGFHVCIDPKKPLDPKVVQKYAHTQTESWRNRARESTTARWEQHREETAERDAKIVDRYKEGGISIKKLGAEFGIHWQTARNVLMRAQERGEVNIRQPGTNAKYLLQGSN